MIIAETFFFLQQLAEGNCEVHTLSDNSLDKVSRKPSDEIPCEVV